MAPSFAASRRVLLLHQGLVFVEGADDAPPLDERLLRALDAELAGLGYACSARLRARLGRLSAAELAEQQAWLFATLAEHLGADRHHEPLFRKFPDDVPVDTRGLWLARVLVHFLQAADQPCLFCCQLGTTHVLKPCMHVVCDRCFDGANYAGCPVCGQHVDRGSPFFLPGDPALGRLPSEPVRFKLLDLGDDLALATARLVRALGERQQAPSPADVEHLVAVLGEHGLAALDWLPEPIPVRETAARVLGELARAGEDVPGAVLARHLRSATDVLRFLAARSGADPALQGEAAWRDAPDGRRTMRTHKRFEVAKLPRAQRRQLLAMLEGFGADALAEDLPRHRSYWIWLGEFLHPGEYATRFPAVAAAFAALRRRRPDGTTVAPLRGRASRLEAAVRGGDVATFLPMLEQRPGELARRLDQALRVTGGDPAVIAAFGRHVQAYATPVLLTLRAHLGTRLAPAPIRVYWPKGAVARGVADVDRRAPLPAAAVEALGRAIEAELLRRFARQPAVAVAVVDRALADVVVPFNERTAARAAIALPRGSRVAVPEGKTLRLFLHWCQPPGPDQRTDLDLSVAFYDAAWRYVGVCSYYQLRHPPQAERPAIAASAGDFTDAPPPAGATEFVDLDRELARAAGIRYAVAVVNAYSGLPFDRLERAFAGLMVREDRHGAPFDPRTVALKFALAGAHGIYLPLALDLDDATLHWLDVHAKGQFELNNVATSKKAVARICPDLMAYFASGARPAMDDMALLHAAARAEQVYLRDGGWTRLARGGDDAAAFLARLRAARGAGDAAGLPPRRGASDAGDAAWQARPGAAGGEAVEAADAVSAIATQAGFAALYHGDLALPAGCARYALFPGRTSGTLAAADLLH